MGIKNIFSPNKLKPHFRFSQSGNIWRLFFNQNNIVAGETRDIQNKQAYIFAFNHVTKKIFLKDFQINEKWWFAIDGINDKHIFVSSFIHPEVPEHKGFEAIDIYTGAKIWENKELEYYFANNNELYGLKQLFESHIVYKLNSENGEILEEIKDVDKINEIVELKNLNDEQIYKDQVNTEILDIDDEIIQITYSSLMEKFQVLKIEGEIEFIKKNNYLIYNYHSRKGINLKNLNENTLTNKLEIIDTRTADFVFEDVLNNETTSYVPDSFFVKNNYLFYIKEKKEIICIELK